MSRVLFSCHIVNITFSTVHCQHLISFPLARLLVLPQPLVNIWFSRAGIPPSTRPSIICTVGVCVYIYIYSTHYLCVYLSLSLSFVYIYIYSTNYLCVSLSLSLSFVHIYIYIYIYIGLPETQPLDLRMGRSRQRDRPCTRRRRQNTISDNETIQIYRTTRRRSSVYFYYSYYHYYYEYYSLHYCNHYNYDRSSAREMYINWDPKQIHARAHRSCWLEP